ncbi:MULTISPECIES: hypothetical protein [unclassified Sphingomonas]|uniref:hypothetical protein n=1 Tax=unclassified Sphingomonas TaxID=196159 RepID=UPI0006F2064D|nr:MULTISPECIES: hypothetical protein [unclassified Sphingomonas]KQM66986.1 hypothetical protein ASE65_02715 [Sphingomonas sp. Leaf16]KQN17932.1 hypothetical protein ASE81_02095 [Sphingomonas sp. Leaf29]KQN23796.1 hypothetical protein ASE83_04975 [Sphingomonas sp. Leaf32]
MTRSAIPFVLPAALLSACAAPAGDYPSLLPRPIEKISLAEPVRPVPVAPADAALDARIATLSRDAAGAKAGFDTAAARAGKTVGAAAGSGEGSERWLGAQVALAELDVARTAIDVPLAELERLAVDRAAAGAPPYPALDAALATANAAASAQRATIATLGARLK